MVDKVAKGKAKKVGTFDLSGKENGFLMELFKEGDKTVAYLSAASPGAFKGYHLHRVRAARYVCLKGTMTIILYLNVPTGLQNSGTEEAWLINYPDPPYDPSLKDEQVDYTQEELEQGVVK
jgi:hypothetical protein